MFGDLDIQDVIVLSSVVGIIATFIVQRYLQKRNEMNNYLTNLQEQIWEFARLSEEYWSFGSDDQRSSNFAPIIRHLSRKIGFQVGYFVSNYTEHSNEFCTGKLTNLRQAATKSPFDRCERDPDPQRCVEIQDAAEQLIDLLTNAKNRWWKLGADL